MRPAQSGIQTEVINERGQYTVVIWFKRKEPLDPCPFVLQRTLPKSGCLPARSRQRLGEKMRAPDQCFQDCGRESRVKTTQEVTIRVGPDDLAAVSVECDEVQRGQTADLYLVISKK